MFWSENICVLVYPSISDSSKIAKPKLSKKNPRSVDFAFVSCTQTRARKRRVQYYNVKPNK